MLNLSRWMKITVAAAVLGLFAVYRWFMRAEPVSSDDLMLFQISAGAANGDHFLLQPSLRSSFLHHHFRLGLLPFAVPAVWLLGPTHLAYYLVPLFFSLCGFALTWRIMHREIHPTFALAFAVVHIVLPFEVTDSCRFFVDVPAAAAALLSLLLIAQASAPSPSGALPLATQGMVAGLAAFESYLLRENQLVLLAPAFLLFLYHKRTRAVMLWAGITIAAGIFLEHLLYVSRGLSWSIRWDTIANDKAGYMLFFPVYTFRQFVIREFMFPFRYFSGWPDGVFAAAFHAVAILAQLVMLWRSSSLLLRAVALFGLTAWGFFAFSFVEFVDGQVRAVAGLAFRYFQPFFYSSLIALCWATAQLYQAATRWRQGWARQAALACTLSIPIGLAGMSLRLSTLYLTPLLHSSGELKQTLQLLDQEASAATTQPLEVYGLKVSLRTISLFRGPWSNPPILWQGVKSSVELASLVQRQVPQLLLQDSSREKRTLRAQRFQSPVSEQGDKDQETLATFHNALWHSYEPVRLIGRYVFYRPTKTPPPVRLLPNGDFQEANLAAKTLRYWTLSTTTVNLSRSSRGHLTISTGAPLPVSLYSGGSPGQFTPPAEAALYALDPTALYTFRVSLQFDSSLSAQLSILQYDATQQVAAQNFILSSGDNYFTIAPVAAAKSYRLALQLRPTHLAGSSTVELVEVSLRQYPRQETSPQQASLSGENSR
jgi:hypothetical protein